LSLENCHRKLLHQLSSQQQFVKQQQIVWKCLLHFANHFLRSSSAHRYFRM
jgi:hypothetical protein